jgi:hypothetical protein
MKLYYLTPSQFALNALALRRLKVARLGELNDPFGLLAIEAETALHRGVLPTRKGEVNFPRFSRQVIRSKLKQRGK